MIGVDKLGLQSLEDLVDKFEDQEWEEFLSTYKICKVIGSGGFGVVLSAIDLVKQKNVALKVVLKGDLRGEMLMQEYEVLRELEHPNIVKLYQLTNFSHYLIMSMKLSLETVD